MSYKVYPNPAQDHLTFELTTDRHVNLQWTIIDMQGRRVYPPQATIQISGTYSETVDVSGLAAGLYLLHLSTEKQQLLQAIRFEVR